MNHTKYWLALQKCGVGFQTVRKLLDSFSGVEELWGASRSQLLATQASPDLIQKFIAARDSLDPDQYVQSVQRPGVTMLSLDQPGYPVLLREIHSPPLVLFVRGNTPALAARSLTVVGTRTPTSYGLKATRTITEPIAREGVVIVSGLAFGIDAAAHEAALGVHGTTVAVLGCGIDDVYPAAHRSLAERILAASGALVTEFPPEVEVQRHFFPQRNRIMAGLSPATLIVEAGEKSGALITSRMALEENREVFAVPGPIDARTSVGPNNLIKMGAAVATAAADLQAVLGLDSTNVLPENVRMTTASPVENELLLLLREVRHVDELVAMSTLDTSVVSATLSMLEMKGRVRHLGGMHYVRIA